MEDQDGYESSDLELSSDDDDDSVVDAGINNNNKRLVYIYILNYIYDLQYSTF